MKKYDALCVDVMMGRKNIPVVLDIFRDWLMEKMEQDDLIVIGNENKMEGCFLV